jgi:hypothetical protein
MTILVTFEKAIEDVYNNPRWLETCKRLAMQNGCPELSDDLYQEFLLSILEHKKPDYIAERFKGGTLDGFCLVTIRRMIASKTSQFYYKYRRHIYDTEAQAELSLKEYDGLRECILDKWLEFRHTRPMSKKFDDGGLFDLLFDWYIEDGSLRKLQERLDIPFTTLAVYIRQYKELVKDSIKECEECCN